MFKLTLPTPVALPIDKIADISLNCTITTNSEGLVESLENDNLYLLSSAVDTLYVCMENQDYFNSKGEFIGA